MMAPFGGQVARRVPQRGEPLEGLQLMAGLLLAQRLRDGALHGLAAGRAVVQLLQKRYTPPFKNAARAQMVPQPPSYNLHTQATHSKLTTHFRYFRFTASRGQKRSPPPKKKEEKKRFPDIC